MTDDAFGRAAATNFTVVRVWAFFDEARGAMAAFQNFDKASNTVVVNTTALIRMDYLLMRAASLGLRLGASPLSEVLEITIDHTQYAMPLFPSIHARSSDANKRLV